MSRQKEKRPKLTAVPSFTFQTNFYSSSEVQLKLHYGSLNCSFGGWILRNSFTSILAKRPSAFKDNLFLERLILLAYINQFQAGLKKFSSRPDSLNVWLQRLKWKRTRHLDWQKQHIINLTKWHEMSCASRKAYSHNNSDELSIDLIQWTSSKQSRKAKNKKESCSCSWWLPLKITFLKFF